LAKKHVLLAICFPTLQALGHNVCGPLAVHTVTMSLGKAPFKWIGQGNTTQLS